ncbi:hypothetical protein CYMTET_6598 [Cymbomonas tetramitiformis]|uniref:Uncharacterized protein n=1 Tax=Cymbomonas tetramitiformis TaxID=36881 RepID=A0AAE0LI91_9CHLO|nr:hypothetical protein CYMTET_6598 [Cymbomonas tetramitiformis]
MLQSRFQTFSRFLPRHRVEILKGLVIFIAAFSCKASEFDGVSNWRSQNTALNRQLYGVSFVTSAIGFASGENGAFAKTVTGGREWRQYVD